MGRFFVATSTHPLIEIPQIICYCYGHMNKVSLRKLRHSDEALFYRWWNDLALRPLTSGAKGRVSKEEVKKYFLEMMRTEFHFMIVVDKKAIGHISLQRRPRGWHETQIVIGEKRFWNKGYGTAAIMRLMRKAAHVGINKIYLEVRPENARAIVAYEKCGFVKSKTVKHDSATLPETIRMVLRH
jgi:RimJ/RimL family protein N-acetyltransferase